MLILSRKKEEVIIINDTIRVKILDIHSDSIKIGVDAPSDIKIYREEIWESIQTENFSAASSPEKTSPTNTILSINKKLASRITDIKNKTYNSKIEKK